MNVSQKGKMRMIKEQFYTLIKLSGFKSLREFARACEIPVGNIHSNVTGKWRPSIERMFIYASTLGVDIDTILAIFYPSEMSKLSD